MKIECALEAKATLGEGPVWCAETGVLFWVDILGQKVHRTEPDSGRDSVLTLDGPVGALALAGAGQAIAAITNRVVMLDLETGATRTLAEPEGALPCNRFNDGKCDRHGRFWVGSMDTAERDPTGALYRVEANGPVTRMVEAVTVANGLGWSSDDSIMYFTDSCLSTIYAYAFDAGTGTLGEKRVFARIPTNLGVPDGLAVDAEDCVWSAHWDGGCLTRYSADGTINRVVHLPVPRPTSLAFGGENLDQMFVTSARFGLSDQQLRAAPLSGGLFRIEGLGVCGTETPRFGG